MMRKLIILFLLLSVAAAYQVPSTYVDGTLNVKNAATLNDTTIASTKTLAVTTIDKLTVGSAIVPVYLWVQVPITATTGNNTQVFIAEEGWTVKAIYEVHGTACSANSGGNTSIWLMKLTGTQDATSQGVSLLSVPIDSKAAASTIQTGTMTYTTADKSLVAGDRIGVRLNNPLTNLANGLIKIKLQRA